MDENVQTDTTLTSDDNGKEQSGGDKKRGKGFFELRFLKLGLVVLLCILTFEFIPGMTSFYAAIAGVICLKPTVKSSLVMGRDRLVGTVIGGAVGLLGMYLFELIGHQLLMIPLFIVVVAVICAALRVGDSTNIACVVLLSVLIMHKPEGVTAYMYVITRAVETVMGVIYAVAVNFIWLKAENAVARKREQGTEK